MHRDKMVIAIRVFVGLIWLLFGPIFKVFGVEPRHCLIVAAILGGEGAAFTTIVIGLLEGALGLWVLTGIRPRTCAAIQTLAIASMNTLELIYAQHILISPILMVCANTIFLSLVWYSALKSSKKERKINFPPVGAHVK